MLHYEPEHEWREEEDNITGESCHVQVMHCMQMQCKSKCNANPLSLHGDDGIEKVRKHENKLYLLMPPCWLAYRVPGC